jgi:hypothetical protein
MPKNLAAQKVSFSADPSSRISAAILVREITLARSADLLIILRAP